MDSTVSNKGPRRRHLPEPVCSLQYEPTIRDQFEDYSKRILSIDDPKQPISAAAALKQHLANEALSSKPRSRPQKVVPLIFSCLKFPQNPLINSSSKSIITFPSLKPFRPLYCVRIPNLPAQGPQTNRFLGLVSQLVPLGPTRDSVKLPFSGYALHFRVPRDYLWNHTSS